VGAGTSEHARDGEPLRSAQRYVMVLTAGVATWNMGAGYLAGLALGYAIDRNWVRL